MSLKCGIVGLPNVGKSTLFNALTKAGIAAENAEAAAQRAEAGIAVAARSAEAERAKVAEAEAERKAEAERQAAEERRAQEAQQAQEQEIADSLAAESAKREAFRFGALIGDRVSQQWVRPPGSSRGLECTLELRLEPTGDVVEGSVRVVSSSGSGSFDNSAIAAVYLASPLPVPTGQTFELLRQFRFKFRP